VTRDTHLRDLIAVVEAGSVRRAALRLGISQAAVSKNLAALEREMGVPLIVRSAHGAEATEHGLTVLRHARVIQDETRRLEEAMAQARGAELTRGVRIGLSSTAEALLCPKALERFRAVSPDVPINILSGAPITMCAALREGRLDFVVSPMPQDVAGPDLRAERLISTDIVLAARAGHPQGGATRLADLAGCEWVVGARQSAMDAALAGLFAAQGLSPPRCMVQRDSFNALLHILLQSDMLALASRPTVEPLQTAGLLAIVPVRIDVPAMVQYLVSTSSRPLGAAAQSLADEFRRVSRAYRR
jgi:DNA-binding transcriptional LysR family regulator